MYLEPLQVDNYRGCLRARSALQLGSPCWLCDGIRCTNKIGQGSPSFIVERKCRRFLDLLYML